MKSRYALVTVIAAFGLVLMGAAAAWACTSSSKLNINPNEGPAGSTIHVNGSGFWGGPLRVYWEPNGSPERELLFERSSGGGFARQATIPADAEGIGYVKAYSYKNGKDPATDQPDRTRTAVFTVTESESEGDEPQGSDGTAQPQGSQGSQPQGSQGTQPQGSEGVEPQPQGSQGSQPEGSEGVESESGRDRESGSQGTAVGGASSQPQPAESSQPESAEFADQAEPAPSAGESAPQPSTEDPPRQQVGEADAGDEAAASDPPRQAVGPSEPAAPQPAAQPEPAGEQAGAAQEPAQSPSTPAPSADQGEPAAAEETAAEPELAPAPQASEPDPASEPEAAEPEAAEGGNAGHPAVSPDADTDEAVTSTEHPSVRSGSTDLWSGLADGEPASLHSPDQPPATEASDTGQSLVLAIALLGAGLLTLATGGTVAARRRRTPAEATTTPRSSEAPRG